jgi:hypothetical protein
MTQVLIEYDARNVIARKTIEYLFSLNLFRVVKNNRRKNGIDEAIEEVMNGNVISFNSSDEAIDYLKNI